mmetsp:Transcript_21395/g.52420  ORF Transcript_21395/g.52420 Transcript_21395/m.52420 type:complete len:804 (-) Transcript_21395:242-2653(-)|eukprot:CAMPEP_0114518376 /NCGR_PEP_ID=MMETSP0109-20121206/18411_1 /TAXON_ID=29199 /ORGANISM="Chlorarachnion reptans, Strain CCCM449" /LENGTH=803 /DNA_ID=CAMNT_0001698993 /DNA_START=60 /DNA_END=2471 /DNA_ORIENTATION=+
MAEKCPICCEDLDLTDLSFKPCKCGYQVCLWCYKDINEKVNGRCPACRAPYKGQGEHVTPDPHKLKEIRKTQTKQQKKKDSRKRASSSGAPDKKQLSTMRVLQRNLVYVVGLTIRVAKEEILRKKQYLGKYGKLLKIVVNKKTLGNGIISYCAYVTFKNAKDAEVAIKKINGSMIDGVRVKATYGTTKYCTNFLRGVNCTNPSCLYLHYLARPEDCFSKEDLTNVDTFNYQELLELSRQASTATSTTRTVHTVPRRPAETMTTPVEKRPATRTSSAPHTRTVAPHGQSETRKTEVRAWGGPRKSSSGGIDKTRPKAPSLKPAPPVNARNRIAAQAQQLPTAFQTPLLLNPAMSPKPNPKTISPPPRIPQKQTVPPERETKPGIGSSNTDVPPGGPSGPNGGPPLSLGDNSTPLVFFSPISGQSRKPPNESLSLGPSLFQQPLRERNVGSPGSDAWKDERWGAPQTQTAPGPGSSVVRPPGSSSQVDVKTILTESHSSANSSGASSTAKKWDFNKFVKDVFPNDFIPGFGKMQLNLKAPASHTRSGSRYSFVGSSGKNHQSVPSGTPPGFQASNAQGNGFPPRPGMHGGHQWETGATDRAPEAWVRLREALPGVKIRYSGAPKDVNGEQKREYRHPGSSSFEQNHDFGRARFGPSSAFAFGNSNRPDMLPIPHQPVISNGRKVGVNPSQEHLQSPGFNRAFREGPIQSKPNPDSRFPQNHSSIGIPPKQQNSYMQSTWMPSAPPGLGWNQGQRQTQYPPPGLFPPPSDRQTIFGQHRVQEEKVHRQFAHRNNGVALDGTRGTRG